MINSALPVRGDIDRGCTAAHSGDDRGAASEQYKRKRPNKFRNGFLHVDFPPSEPGMMPDKICERNCRIEPTWRANSDAGF